MKHREDRRIKGERIDEGRECRGVGMNLTRDRLTDEIFSGRRTGAQERSDNTHAAVVPYRSVSIAPLSHLYDRVLGYRI